MLSREQIEFFHTNGFLIMPNLIRGAELEALQRAADLVETLGVNHLGQGHLYQSVGEGLQVYWRSEDIWNRGDIFKAVTVHPELLENIGQCLGHPFFPLGDSLVVKLPFVGAPVAWHQDPPYSKPGPWSLHTETFDIPNFDTDIYLDNADANNGCVYTIPGSHLVGYVDLTNRSEEELFEKCGAVPVEMRAGDVLFHGISSLHGSRANFSSRKRRVFYIHYQNREVWEDANSDWKSRLVWHDDMEARARDMIEVRRGLGLDDPLQRGTVNLDVDGFAFTAEPQTSARYWAEMKRRIGPEELKTRKSWAT